MAFREIRQTQQKYDVNALFEDAAPMEQLIRRPSPAAPVIRDPEYVPQKRIIGTYSEDSVPLENFPLVKKRFNFHLPQFPEMNKTVLKSIVILGIKFVVGVALVYFGLTFTGSAFGPASGKFLKEYATVFYQFQLGTLMAMFGAILVYDGLRHR